MDTNHPSEDSLDPKDLAKTRVIESDPGSGTPLRFGGARRRPQTPPVISDHELLRVIGQGAYGEVWLARNIMGAYRAVKIVYRDSFESDRPYEREFSGIQSFEPISRSHESQVDILHIGRNEAQKCFYYVMELADDANAESGEQKAESRNWEAYAPKTVHSELKRRGRFTFAESLDICLALTTAIEHLHKHGLIHRDIKPANVIFVNGLPKLADIGLVTETGGTMSFVGTEGYLPPEGPGSVQADIYSLGKTLYEVATGKDRFEFPELPTLIGSPSEETQLFELNEVLLKACHPDRDGRYRHASDMHADLVLLQAGKSIRRSRAMEQRLALLTKIAAGVLLVASLSAAAYVYQQFQTREALRLAQAETFQRTRAEGLLKTVQSKQVENEHLLTTLQLKQAENYFENDEAGKGVAYLARMLRQNPSNHIAAARMMSALTDRSFALPLRVFEHPEKLSHVAFSLDGQRIVFCTGSDTNSTARIWDARTGEAVGKPMQLGASVGGARFSPDGRFIATTSEDWTARVWDAVTGEPVTAPLTQDGPRSGKAETAGVAFSPDGQSLITFFGGNARVWKVPTGEPLIPKFNHGAVIAHAEFSPDGRRFLTTSYGTAPKIWDAVSGELKHVLNRRGNPHHGYDLAQYSPDGSRIAESGGSDVHVWDANTGELLQQLDHEAEVVSVAFSPDGLRIATGDQLRAARVWDAQTGQLLLPPLIHKGQVNNVQFDPSGERLLTYESWRARIWDSRTGRPLSERMANLHSVRFSPDGLGVLGVGWNDQNVFLWDVRPGQALNVALRHKNGVHSPKLGNNGKKVVASTYDTLVGEVALWDARTGEPVGPLIKVHSTVRYAEFSPEDRRIVTASENSQARIWDAETGAPLIEPLWHSGPINQARFSPDGLKLATASADQTARVWDAQTGQPLTDPLVHTNQVFSTEFSPDGRWILTVTAGVAAQIWDAQTGKFRFRLSHGEWINGAGFSPDGKHIVTASHDNTARLWDSQTGKAVGVPMKHQNSVWLARFSPDGRYIVTTSADHTARIWDAATGQPVTKPLEHSGAVNAARFSRDGRRVVTASRDNTARAWDAQSGRPLTEPFRHDDWILSAEFSPDGTRVLTSSKDGTARIWEFAPAEVPVPGWVLDLAEAVVGQRLTDEEVAEPVHPEEFLALKKRLLEASDTDRFSLWAKWLLSDRLARNTSFSSGVSGSTHLERLLEGNSERTLREALHFSPENAVATARLARQLAGTNAGFSGGNFVRRGKVAAFLAERAVKLNPEEPQAWWAKAEALEQAGRHEEALQTSERALALTPDFLKMWQLKAQWLEKAGQDESALQAYAKAVALVEPSRETPDSQSETAEARKTVLLKRAALFARLGRLKESVDDNLRARGIPPRTSEATPEQIDLALYYNAGLTEDWHPGPAQNDLASLPRGLQTLAGVRWDLRGLIQLGRESPSGEPYPKRVSGISVGLACQRIHFLHAAISTEGLQEVQIGKYVVHFADGRASEIPVVVGRDLNNWWSQGGEQGKPFVIAWTGTNAATAENNSTIRLFRSTWENPTPEAAVQSIDLVSTHDRGAPFLLAITAQKEPTPTITRQPQPQIAAQGDNVAFQVEAKSEVGLTYQWQFNGKDIAGATDVTLSLKSVNPDHAGTYAVRVQNALKNSVFSLTSQSATLLIKASGFVHGAVRHEIFTNIVGSKLKDLTNHTGFPDRPDGVDLVHQFEAPSNFAENYGVRLTGYLKPPKTGEYRFYLCSDDEGALFLSTDDSPEHKRQIAHEPEWNGERLWTTAHARPKRDNVSEPIHLEAGRHYYIEALMKEGQREDNLAVTWQMPGEPPPENFSPPIPGTYLAVPAEWTKSPPTPLASDSKVP